MRRGGAAATTWGCGNGVVAQPPPLPPSRARQLCMNDVASTTASSCRSTHVELTDVLPRDRQLQPEPSPGRFPPVHWPVLSVEYQNPPMRTPQFQLPPGSPGDAAGVRTPQCRTAGCGPGPGGGGMDDGRSVSAAGCTSSQLRAGCPLAVPAAAPIPAPGGRTSRYPPHDAPCSVHMSQHAPSAPPGLLAPALPLTGMVAKAGPDRHPCPVRPCRPRTWAAVAVPATTPPTPFPSATVSPPYAQPAGQAGAGTAWEVSVYRPTVLSARGQRQRGWPSGPMEPFRPSVPQPSGTPETVGVRHCWLHEYRERSHALKLESVYLWVVVFVADVFDL